MRSKRGAGGIAGTTAPAVFAVDLLTKWLALRTVGPSAGQRDRWLIGEWLGLSYSENTGIAFGLLRDSSVPVLALVMIAAIAGIGVFVWSHRDVPMILLAGGLVAGGATGNLIDRIRFGYVRDFIAVGPWPPFNLADSAITIGAIITAWCLLRPQRHHPRPIASERRTLRTSSTPLEAPK